MTCLPFCSSRATWNSLLALAVVAVLPACSIFNGTPESDLGKETVSSPTRERSYNRIRANQFEWAVQSYEAGDYPRAISQFRQLEKAGPSVADFDLIPYYLGMSYFNSSNNREAARYLEKFLQMGKARRESQDARMALLLIYERLSDWPKLLGLAAETENVTLFQNNRALLKLLWARALIENNETMGAKGQLKDATQYLDLTSGEDRSILKEAERDVWGRYYYTSLLVSERECLAMNPQKIAAGKGSKTLYANWLEGSVECLRTAITLASNEVFSRESIWSPQASNSLNRNIDGLATKLRRYLAAEGKSLKNRQALERAAQGQLYRLLTELDKHIKSFKNRDVNSAPLELIRKRVDLLLVSLSRPS